MTLSSPPVRLPALPPAPRSFLPSLEQRIALRGNAQVFWTYALLVCGISFLVAGFYAGNRTTLTAGGALAAAGLLLLGVRAAVGSTHAKLLRSGDWTLGRVIRVESRSKVRRVDYTFAVDGVDRSGSVSEEKPWADEFVEGADVAILFDPRQPRRSTLLSRAAVDAMCESWRMRRES